MSHELEMMEDGRARIAFVGDLPWHGLGQRMEEGASITEWREAAGHNFEVFKTPDFVNLDGEYIDAGTEKLIRDTDHKILSTVSEEWEPVFMEEFWDFFEKFRKQEDLELETAGVIKEGKICWILAKIRSEAFELFGMDVSEPYLLFTNFYIYGRATDIRNTIIRAVCNNTVSAALSKSSKNYIKLNHRQAFDPERAATMLGMAKQQFAEYHEMAEFLSKRKATRKVMVEYFKDLLPGPGLRKVEDADDKLRASLSLQGRNAYDALDEQPGAEFGEGTWWQAFNAVTYTVDHKIGRHISNRLENSWYGNGSRLKTKALEKAVEYADADR